MSGGPYPAGARELILLVDRLDYAQANERKIRAEVTKLEAAVDIRQDLEEQITKLLESMDLRSAGNAGWRSRLVEIIVMITRATSEEP